MESLWKNSESSAQGDFFMHKKREKRRKNKNTRSVNMLKYRYHVGITEKNRRRNR